MLFRSVTHLFCEVDFFFFPHGFPAALHASCPYLYEDFPGSFVWSLSSCSLLLPVGIGLPWIPSDFLFGNFWPHCFVIMLFHIPDALLVPNIFDKKKEVISVLWLLLNCSPR